MYKILVMTDLHVMEEGGRIIGLSPGAMFARALAHALTQHPDANALILTGDLTHHGRPAQYERLRALLAHCPIPVHYLIGNHDARPAFQEAFPDAAKDSGGFVQSAQVHGDDLWITLDTKHDYTDEAEKHSGFLCAARLNWLRETLAEHPDKRALVFMHHPPFDVGFAGMDRIKLMNGPEVLNVLNAHAAGMHLIAGHVHRTMSGNASGISFSMFKSTCHQMPMVTEAVETSLSVAEPAAYGILFVSPESIIAHTEDFDIAVNSARPQKGVD